MKIINLIFAVIFLLTINTLKSQSILIGNFNNPSTSFNTPIYNIYGNSWSANIYHKSDIGGSCIIDKIAFDVATLAYDSAYNIYDNQKIYLAEVSDSVFINTSYISPSSVNATLVYNGTVDFSSLGWNEIDLQTNYYYSGQNNLLILYENRSGKSYIHNMPEFNAEIISYGNDKVAKYNTTSNLQNFTNSGYYSYRSLNLKLDTLIQVFDDLLIDSIMNPLNGFSGSSTETISISLKNNGVNSQTGFNISYSIDGGQNWITETYNSTINSFQSVVYNFNTTANLLTPGYYNIKVAVSLNGDVNNSNDTISRTLILQNTSLGGSYIIGNSPTADYPNLNIAIDSLEYFGMYDTVIFNLLSGTYNQQINFDSINFQHRLIIQSLDKCADSVIMEYDASSGQTPGIFNLYKSSNVTIKHLTLNPIDDIYAAGVSMIDAHDNKVSNCKINGSQLANNFYGAIIYLRSTMANGNYNNVIDSNIMDSGYASVFLNSTNSPNTTFSSITISNNSMENYLYYGIFVYDADSTVITKNYLHTTGNVSHTIKVQNTNSFLEISNNHIISFDVHAIYINNMDATANKRSRIYNNFIITRGTRFPIYLVLSEYVNIDFNSVLIYGGSGNAGSLSIHSNNNINIRNNNIINLGGGFAINHSNNTFNEFDYNNLYSTGPNITLNDTSINSLQASTSTNYHSISINTIFADSVDLHVNSIGISNIGKFLPYVEYDIDGDERDTLYPDIGADEFPLPSPNTRLKTILNPKPLNNIGEHDITIKLQNFSENTLDSILINYQINNVITDSFLFTDSIMKMQTLDITIDSINLPVGSYSLKVWTTLNNGQIDVEPSTDTLYSSFTIDSLPIFQYITDTLNLNIEWCNDSVEKQILFTNTGYDDLFCYVYSYNGNYSVSPLTNTVSPDDTSFFNLKFNSSGLAVGDYTAQIVLKSNDIQTESIIIPINYKVQHKLHNKLNLGPDTSGCGTVTLTAPNIYDTYLWNNGSNTSSTIVTNTGSYNLSVTDSGYCNTSDTIYLEINSLPNVNINPVQNKICKNGPNIKLSASPNGGIFTGLGVVSDSLFVDSLNIGVSFVKYYFTDSNNCSSEDSISFQIVEPSEVIFQNIDSVYCAYDTAISLIASPSNGVFSGADVNMGVFDPGSVSSNYSNIIYEAIDNNSCTTIDSIKVLISNPVLNITLDTVFCWGNEILLEAGNGFSSYLWSTGENTQSILIDSNIYNIGFNYFQVEVQDSVGCFANDSVFVEVLVCTSIDEERDFTNQVRLYPNPTKADINIKVVNKEASGLILDLFASDGRLIKSELIKINAIDDTYNLSLEGLAKGIYYLKLSNTNFTNTYKIIKN